MKKNNGNGSGWFWFIIIFLIIIFPYLSDNKSQNQNTKNRKSNSFRIISSTSTSMMDDEIINYAKGEGINVQIEHYGDLEIVEKLNTDSIDYDAVWISNSMWLYMLNNNNTIDSKSIVIDPVVIAIQKSKAEELGFVNSDVYNKDILNAIKNGKLKYIMPSVTQTNSGATAYLSFLNSLAGNPEILTSDMLKNVELQSNLVDLFKGVERVSGDEEDLKKFYLNGNYNAMINYESSLIELNKELVAQGKEPLYLIYPRDGVAINDMPFAYINNDANDAKMKEKFNKIQLFLRSEDTLKKMEEKGYRSWYGGIKENTDKNTFNPSWGIDTSKYLKDMKYPSKKVITEAIDLYIEKFRKPTHVVFCLDISGSMYGSGIKELIDAMNYILNYESASNDNLQFSKNDKITIITFNDRVDNIYDTKLGSETEDVIKYINSLEPYGATNIYSPSIEALKILSQDDSADYTKTVILMTDGESNTGSYKQLSKYYIENNLDIPIYSITFGYSSEHQLNQIAELTNGKVFDGKSGLKEAFKEVRSYN